MTNYRLKPNQTVSSKEIPKRKISEKRKRRLALLTRIEIQRIRGVRNLMKKNS
jgi:hypothetical protein